MYAVLVSAARYVFGTLINVSFIKWAVLAAIYAVVFALSAVLMSFIPSWFNLNGVFNSVPAGMWWFLDMVNITYGMPIIISAWVSRFIIRRLPVIG